MGLIAATALEGCHDRVAFDLGRVGPAMTTPLTRVSLRLLNWR